MAFRVPPPGARRPERPILITCLLLSPVLSACCPREACERRAREAKEACESDCKEDATCVAQCQVWLSTNINSCQKAGGSCLACETCSVGRCVLESRNCDCHDTECAYCTAAGPRIVDNGSVCRCGGVCSGGRCVTDFNNDEENCGGCTRKCQPGETCCSGRCANVMSDDVKNCGACGRSCPPNATCLLGTCKFNPYYNGGTKCDYQCPAGCYRCDASGTSVGVCLPGCDKCLVCKSGSCVWDPVNEGTLCDDTLTRYCHDGKCELGCAKGQTVCDLSAIPNAWSNNRCCDPGGVCYQKRCITP
jgi:hypothetical protein